MKTFTIALSDEAYRKLQDAIKNSGRSQKNCIINALGLLMVALKSEKANQKLIVTDNDGVHLKEIVLI